MLKRSLLLIALILLTPLPLAAQVGNFARVVINGTNVTSGSGSPEGAVVGAVGDVYLRTSNGTIYTKTSGSGNTGWTLMASGGGSGTVTSVGLTLPGLFSVSGSPVTTSGTIAGSLATQSANTVFAGPTSGAAAQPAFRAIVFGDWASNSCASGQVPKYNGSAWACADDAGASSGAPTASQYVTLATDASLTNERVLTAGTGITLTDAGAGSTLTVAADGANIGSLSAANISAGTLAVARGGTNLTSATDDNTMVGNGTTWQSKALPSCSGSSSKLLYDTATNAFSCGTDAGASGALGWNLLDTQTASASATIDFANLLSGSYDNYVVIFDGVLPATDAVDLVMLIGTGATPTWDTGSVYRYAVSSVVQTSVDSNDGNNGTTTMRLIQAIKNDTTGGGINGQLLFFNANSTARYKGVTWQVGSMSDVGGFRGSNGNGLVMNASVTTSLRFQMSSGNIASGTFRLYGIAQ